MGNFAIESAIDELSYELGMDPLELRRRNHAEVHPQFGLRWSSKALRECYKVGAERFGWSRRNPEVASMRDGHWQVGYGLAGVAYSSWQVRCDARATVRRDGTALVRSAASDIGTGTWTVMRQLSAELLGLELGRVRVDLGDSDMPWSPAAGGSGLTTSLGTADHADVPDMDIVFVGEPDPLTPIGTKGVGEVGLPGTAAALANAVYHATGRRIRSLPITIDQLL